VTVVGAAAEGGEPVGGVADGGVGRFARNVGETETEAPR